MIYKDFFLEYDKNLVTEEILSCSHLFFEIPPYSHWIDSAIEKRIPMVETLELYQSITHERNKKIIKKEISPPRSFYLRSSNFDFKSYAVSKFTESENCQWHPAAEIKIPYTKKLIENLPFKKISIVRVFILNDTFLPTHSDESIFDKHNLGISLVPVHSGTPLIIYDNDNVHRVFSSSFIFNDSYLHGIPMVNGLRIDIRVFGDLEQE